jgi:cobalt/nickel transport system ATP-binding protein
VVTGVLRAVAVDFAYPGGPPVLTGAELEVRRGSRLAVLGANGSGKSTLLRCLTGALRPDAGRIEVEGRPLQYSRGGLRRHRQVVQLVTQDPDDQLFSASVRADVSFGPVNLGLPESEVRDRVTEALDLLAVGHLADRPTHQLSYGERKRVAIAGAVSMRPAVLALDEPTAGLDPSGVEDALGALAGLAAAGTTLVMATHDVDLALAWADEVAVVVGGGVRRGAPTTLLRSADLLDLARLRRPWVITISDRLRPLGVLPPHAEPRDEASLLEMMLHPVPVEER